MTATEVIKGPVITEKGTLVSEIGNQVVLRVHPHANKVEIRQAVEQLFEVDVVDVKVLKVQAKPKRRGLVRGTRPGWKKAVVKIREGQEIQIFEGAQV